MENPNNNSSKLSETLQSYFVERDEQDPSYIKSFDLSLPNAEQEILSFFDEFGFVVVRNVLTEQQCNNTTNDLFSTIESLSGSKFNRSSPSTWSNWPSQGLFIHGMPDRSPAFTKSSLENRQNPLIYKVFSLLLQEPNLIVNHDRWCLFRPTKQIYFPETQNFLDKPNWATKTNLHMDMNPFGYYDPNTPSKIESKLSELGYGPNKLNHFIFENNQIHHSQYKGLHLQGVINLHDNKEDDGGFWCVPGFKHHFEEWTKDMLSKKEQIEFIASAEDKNSVSFAAKGTGAGASIYSNAIRIPMRKGSLVVWDQRTPHGAKKNNSNNARMAQFLKMYPKEGLEVGKRREARRETLRSIVRRLSDEEGFEMTELGRKLFDLEDERGANNRRIGGGGKKRKGNARIVQ